MTAFKSDGGQKNQHLPNIIAFKNNVLKLNFVRVKKVHILTKEVNIKTFLRSKPQKCQPGKGILFGALSNSGSLSQNTWTSLQNVNVCLN